jgi:hypothetical protein
MWHFTAAYAKRGDIGKWTDAEIAAHLEWSRGHDELISALIDTRWLDRCSVHRLLVHDWSDHADQTVKRSEEVLRYGFAKLNTKDPKVVDASNQLANASNQLANASQPSQVLAKSKPSPSPSPKPLTAPQDASIAADGDDGDGIWKEVKTEGRRIAIGLKVPPPTPDIRRKVSAAILLAVRGDMPPHWLKEAVDRTDRKKPKSPWNYLWTCLRNSASDLGRDLCAMTAAVELPEGF